MFAGGNTPQGFFSFFDNIPPPYVNRKTIYLKGSSGSGKSSFIKRIGAEFEKEAFDVDYFHCSNDADRIDGLCIQGLNISLIDGTSPHVCDPALPGLTDEIINLTDFLDTEIISSNKAELLLLTEEKKQYYQKAYNYLKAAHSIRLNNRLIRNQASDKTKINKETLKILKNFKNNRGKSTPVSKKFFASAITPDGLISFTDTLLNAEKVYLLNGEDGAGTDIMLNDILRMATLRGLSTESFYCPMSPEKPEHLIIPGAGICFTTNNKYHKLKIKPAKEIFFKEFTNDETQYNDDLFDNLLKKATYTMKQARTAHERIEEIYIRGMDFCKLDALCQETISKLRRYAEWTK